eukprot:TRINITY_DN3030_c0_g1_i10.p1 TRINITY_DN3030_c0_g1~~TRINITY_DN3030_c0_g1_i10.p1  ORF type:complete len:132 (-),score=19.91 TRINITY_DN3030_c0_g1_i10:924-1319(-)
MKINKPKTSKELERFLGRIEYFQGFMPRFSNVVAPLYNMLNQWKPGSKLSWNEVTTGAVDKLKNMLRKTVEVYTPDYSKSFHIYTDVSTNGMGCVLGQFINKMYQPVAFAGKKFTKVEMNYSTPKQELCAI